ncbi:MAG: Porphobilinogen deaminase, partial [Myxococcaceae bacterium]|nr:Porphobilinogen deaminase [Myxococcaceae bacterium]
MKVRIATRKSPLALAQVAWVTRELKRHHPGIEVSELHIVTLGDRIQDRPLSEVGGKGLFVTEIEEALGDGRADLAVHSMKDVPAQLADGLTIACV